MSAPMVPHHVDPTEILLEEGAEEQTHLAIKRLCARLLPGWAGLEPDDMDVASISGGISNLLVKVSPHSRHGLEPVAFKVFGHKTELLIDREQELQVLLKLNSCGFGAKVLAMFANGRIEEFLIAKTLTPPEMGDPHFVPRIAATLRRLHGVPTDGVPTLWPTIQRWFDMASKLTFDDPDKQRQYEQVDLELMRQEIEATKAICDQAGSPIVFSHNDLLSGNILIVQQRQQQGQGEQQGQQPSDDSSMQFIDYEYSACGYRGFDFGNHFNEYAGFECDYSRYPSPQQQHLFFRHYLAAGACRSQPTGSGSGGDDQEDACASSDPSPLMLERMEAEANLFALASHIYWGVWALIQARYSPIDFDYLQYSGTRWGEYHRRKDEFVAQARRVLLAGKH